MKQKGFSLIEVLVVLTLILSVGATASYYLNGHKKLYKTDDQTLLIADLLQEARQRSLTQRETMRVEIDLTENHIRLIDENKVRTSDDDVVLRILPVYFPNEVRIDRRAANIGYNPPEPLPVPTAAFLPSVYPSSTTHQVCTLRFQSDGTVVDAGTNSTGTGAVISGVTIHIWQPNGDNPDESSIARALTVIGSTGSVKLWEFDPSFPNDNKWKDSRRAGSYGGNPQN
ncbi:MAG: prepilin-type N-terminal cleavage/methylation domain-containing protein [Pyrinomonadaceae bacterium]